MKNFYIKISGFLSIFIFLAYLNTFNVVHCMKPSKVNVSNIPVSLEECCLELDKICNQELKDEIKLSLDDDLYEFHFKLGMWIRNNWISPLEKGGICALLLKHGSDSADEMSSLIIENYNHYLNGKSITIEELIRNYRFRLWKRFDKNLKKEDIVVHCEKSKRCVVL